MTYLTRDTNRKLEARDQSAPGDAVLLERKIQPRTNTSLHITRFPNLFVWASRLVNLVILGVVMSPDSDGRVGFWF